MKKAAKGWRGWSFRDKYLALAIPMLLFFNTVLSQSDFYTTFPSGTFTSGALVHLPPDYFTAIRSYQCIVFFPGTGEVGIDTTKIAKYGPHDYLRSGWDGGVALANGIYYPILISIQLPATYKRPWDLKILLDNIQAAYRINTINITGLSMGGWEAGIFATYQPTAGDHTYQDYVKSIVALSPVTPSDTYDGTPSYPARFADYATAGGKAFFTNQSVSDVSDVSNIPPVMNAAVASSATWESTTNGGGTHCCWEYEYGGNGAGATNRTPRTHVINGTTENIYQFMLRSGGDTTILPTFYRASAGVYRQSDSVLLRTQFSNVTVSRTDTSWTWDGKDDYGNTISPKPAVFLKNLTSNVNYTWEGIIGNTSSANTGTGVHRGYYTSMTGMAITGTTAYFCQGYSERYSSVAKFNISSPQVRLDIAGFGGNLGTLNTDYVATDGINVYWAGFHPAKTSNSCVYATKVSNDAQVSFGSNGSVYTMTNTSYPKTYTSIIDSSLTNNSRATGLAVQQAGTYLFVAHGRLNQLHVLNKTTGARVQTLSITNPQSLSTEGSSLWMVSGTNTVAKYTINANGTLTAATLTLSGLATAGAIQANGTGTLAVIDNTNQIVRFFNTTTGVESTALGTSGGYATSPTVTNTKFMFDDLRGNVNSFIAFAPDGSFWFGDGGNYRELHYTAGKSYIEYIMSMGACYSTSCDPNNITRVFGNYLEFAVDYSQPITGSTGWTLVKNWGYNSNANTGNYKILNIVTLSNGRTYGRSFVPGVGYCELTATGLRSCGAGTNLGTGIVNKDGTMMKFTGGGNVGQSIVATKYPAPTFDGSGNPVWSTSGTVVASPPTNTLKHPNAIPTSVGSSGEYNYITTTGKFAFYLPSKYSVTNNSVPWDGMHLGAMKQGQSQWLWEAEKANATTYNGNFPPVEVFEMGNGVNNFAGSHVNVVGNNIITGYHGEFWKNGQVNYYAHFNEDGLAIGQFGADFYQFTHNTNVYPTPQIGLAGNALTPIAVLNSNGNIQLIHGDESYHAGVHVWTISGLNTINEYVLGTVSNIPPVANAGTNITITLPTNTTTLSGSGTDADGTISTYAWTKTSGPASGSITSPSSASTGLTGLVQGLYQFTLTVTDNQGATNSDVVNVTVNAAINQAPSANAGTDQAITLPTSSVTLSGSGTDPDGTISSYAWAYISGPAGYTITSPSSASTTITGLTQGTFVFELTVTDNSAATGKDRITITVNQAANVLPSADAGIDQTITLPTNFVTLTGIGTDADGSIVSYLWSKVSGPAGETITNYTATSTTVTSLTAGTYIFKYLITDDRGGKDSDNVQVVVNPKPGKVKRTLGSGSGSIYFINGSPFTVNAGDTICITAGTYTNISLDGLHGTITDSILIINCGGQVKTVNLDSTYGFRIVNSQFFHFTGTGDPGFFYGFKTGNGVNWQGSGMNIKDSTSDYEVDHYEAWKAENGFLCKIDPSDSSLGTYSNGWTINNPSYHDNYVHVTKGEGLYFANTAQTVTVKTYGGADTTVEPVMARNGKFYNNIFDSTGWDGLQVAATVNAQIYRNIVTNAGQKYLGSQQAGILLGGKSTGTVHDNYINTVSGNGLEIFGYSKITVYNNIIANTGIDSVNGNQDGVFVDDRPYGSLYNGLYVWMNNNTVVNSGLNAIKFSNSNGTMDTRNKVYGNYIVTKGGSNYIDFGSANVDSLQNVYLATIPAAHFMGASDFHLSYNSPAIGQVGIDPVYYGISSDYDGVIRNVPYDAGAYQNRDPGPDVPAIRDFIIIHGKIIFR